MEPLRNSNVPYRHAVGHPELRHGIIGILQPLQVLRHAIVSATAANDHCERGNGYDRASQLTWAIKLAVSWLVIPLSRTGHSKSFLVSVLTVSRKIFAGNDWSA